MEVIESDKFQEPADPNLGAVIEIFFQVVSQGLNMLIRLDGDEILRQRLPLINIAQQTLVEAVREQLQTVFYDLLPVGSVRHVYITEMKGRGLENLRLNLDHLMAMVQKTNLALLKHKNRVIGPCEHNRTLIYNLEGHEFLKDVYEYASSSSNTALTYREFHNGWCQNKRSWSREFNALSTDELVDLIHAEKLYRIVSVNMYYLTIIAIRENIYLLALLKYLGVEFNVLEWDIHEINPSLGLDKSSYRCDDFVRYDFSPSLQDQWNQYKKLKKICYFSVNPVCEDDIQFSPRTEDFEIVCAANSRIEVLNPVRTNRVLAAFEFCRQDKLFHDFQFWFHTISYFLATRVKCDYLQKLKVRADLVNVHFDGISLLKYEALDQLETDRKVTLYGDQGWARLFPQYFSGEYLQKEKLWERVQRPDCLYLQMNNVFSYVESNPVVGYALSNSAPFIGFPAVVKTEEFSGFSQLEYNSPRELNAMIENINERIEAECLTPALENYKEVMTRSKLEGYDNIIQGASDSRQYYRQWCDVHFKEFELQAKQYIAEHEQELLKFLNDMYEPDAFQWQSSPFSSRGYVQMLMKV